MKPLLAAVLAAAAWHPRCARAQLPSSPTFAAAPAVPVSSAPQYGIPLDPARGPWVLGEVRFAGNKAVGLFALQGRIRARPGLLFTPSDLANDVKQLQGVPNVLTARGDVYGIPGQGVPDAYLSIAASTMQVRVVYTIEEKGLLLPGLTPPTTAQINPAKLPPVPKSGVVLTPTAYRGFGRFTSPGLGMDINTVYYIGRLYGKNSVSSPSTNYLDRIGQWIVTADGKMQLQSEGDIRPAAAVGAQGILTFRDAPQPSINGPFNVSVDVSNNKTKSILSDGYFVLSKRFWKTYASLGYMYGNAGDEVSLLTEFLTPQSLQFFYNKGAGITPTSNSVLFGSLMAFPLPHYPLAVEFMKPNGMPLNPLLINFKVGYFLKLNFDVSYLRFQGGYDVLGTFQFRYAYFPRG